MQAGQKMSKKMEAAAAANAAQLQEGSVAVRQSAEDEVQAQHARIEQARQRTTARAKLHKCAPA